MNEVQLSPKSVFAHRVITHIVSLCAGSLPIESYRFMVINPPRSQEPRIITEVDTHAVTVALGTRLGHYEVTGALGAGGVGKIRAGDTRLKPGVAPVILPESFETDAERLVRCQCAGVPRRSQPSAHRRHPTDWKTATLLGSRSQGTPLQANRYPGAPQT
jgi:hypothetical protein